MIIALQALRASGDVVNTATVKSIADDPNPGNNSDRAVCTRSDVVADDLVQGSGPAGALKRPRFDATDALTASDLAVGCDATIAICMAGASCAGSGSCVRAIRHGRGP